MKRMTVAQASRSLGEYATDLKDEIVIVTKGRRPLAALVPLGKFDRDELRLTAHPEFLRLIKRSRAEIRAGKSVSLTEMRKRVLPTPAAAKRAKRRVRKRRSE